MFFTHVHPLDFQAHELPKEKLDKRKIYYIDIANDPVKSSDYKEEWDPTKIRSEKAGRGPLARNWRVRTWGF